MTVNIIRLGLPIILIHIIDYNMDVCICTLYNTRLSAPLTSFVYFYKEFSSALHFLNALARSIQLIIGFAILDQISDTGIIPRIGIFVKKISVINGKFYDINVKTTYID